MKISDIEVEVIKKYVVKSKQERILWELSNPEKRKDIIFKRFPGPNLFKSHCLQEVGYMSEIEMEKKLFQLSKTTEVYYIGERYIGSMSLKDAVRRTCAGEICIIYCGQGIGYYQGEQDYGSPPRFLLIQKD